MNRCLRCNQPCGVSSILCEQCRLQLQQHGSRSESEVQASLLPTPMNDELFSATATFPPRSSVPETPAALTGVIPLSNATVPMESISPDCDFPPQTTDVESTIVAYPDPSEHSLHQLNDAARLIAASEPDAASGVRGLRVSRLSPLRDISAEIQRSSTPLPNTAFNTEPGSRDALDEHLPDLWPWLHMVEIDEEKDEWVDRTDPLLSRRLPTSAESRRIKKEEISPLSQRRLAQVWANLGLVPKKWIRLLFVSFSVLAVAALLIDGLLVAFSAYHSPVAQTLVPPTMTLSTRFANYGDHVTVHFKDFPPLSTVVLSHDIQEHVKLLNGAESVSLDAKGSKDVDILIEDGWEPGSHTLEAEDIHTRYTASAMLLVGVGSTRPSHLSITESEVDLGSLLQGANSLHTIRLANSGGGAINWSASSSDSWLMLTPNHGMFSDYQDIQIAADRTNLAPGEYHGTIIFSSNVSQAQKMHVHMLVQKLPPGTGAVLSVTPAVISFTAIDGRENPNPQSLVISNPGRVPLYWTIHTKSITPANSYLNAVNTVATTSNWLNAAMTSGMVAPGSMTTVNVIVQSLDLLPGMYTGSLIFSAASGHPALNSPQTIGLSLTIQPRCSLLLNTGSLTFTAIAGQVGTSNQVLNMSGNTTCGDSTHWSALSSARWLTITPGSGQLNAAEASSITTTVNPAGLAPGTYTGTIMITLAQNTQTVAIVLTVQSPPPPSAPIIGASPLNLNFSMVKGQVAPPGQVITVANTGHSALAWAVNANPPANWLSIIQSQTVIAPEQTGSLIVRVDPSGLTAGKYSGQIFLSGLDSNGNLAAGSPQAVGIIFMITAPCALTLPSASELAFSSTQGMLNDPTPQQVVITATGNCNWPLSWNAGHNAAASWLKLAADAGTLTTSGQSATIIINPSNAGLLVGRYQEYIQISATDAAGVVVPGSPQALLVDFTILKPCTLQSNSPGLTFSIAQGQSAGSQSVPLSLTGNCLFPIAWTATADSSWLNFSSSSGSDNGQGSTLGVNVNSSGLAIGTYKGIITVAPAWNGGASVAEKPQIPVTLTITGASVSVTLTSCDAICTNPLPFAGALVNLYDATGTVIGSGTTSADGMVTISNVPLGAYSILATGTDATGVIYSGNSVVAVADAVVSVSLNATANTVTTPSTP